MRKLKEIDITKINFDNMTPYTKSKRKSKSVFLALSK
jgi:hypothetical protein